MRTKVPSFLRLLYGPLDNMSKFLKVSGITVAVGVALYAGLGYFGVPYVARTVLERFGSTELGRTVPHRGGTGHPLQSLDLAL